MCVKRNEDIDKGNGAENKSAPFLLLFRSTLCFLYFLICSRFLRDASISIIAFRENPVNIKEHLDLDAVRFGIMQMLDILNKEEQSIDIEDSHMLQIKEYLTLLDLVVEIDLESLPEVNKKGKVCHGKP